MNHIVGFITGHSVRGCSGLSQEQRDFQRRSVVPSAAWLSHNFPWEETFPFPETFPLLIASCNNVRHYFGSRRAAFRETHRAEVLARLTAYDAVILLTGSCGMELLNNLDLPVETRQRLHIFGYGSVSRRRPEVASCFLLQGEHDILSRLFHSQVDLRFPCSHMGYLAATETLQQFDAFYLKVLKG